MTQPAYPAAHDVAARIEPLFARQLAAAREQGERDSAPLPDAQAVEAMLDAAFWASLRREEGYAPRISLAFVPAEQVARPLRFENRLRLLPGSLARLAPAVERPGIHLGVWREGDALHVWGATRTLPPLCFVIEVVAPGLLVVKHRGRDAAKFVNVVVVEGDQIKFVDERRTMLPGCPPVLASMLGTATVMGSDEGRPLNVPLQLAVSMRSHKRGGALLVVPSGSDAWWQSIVRPVSYSLLPTDSDVGHLLRSPADERHRLEWRESMHRAVEALAGLTAVDGATIISDSYGLFAFGAKLRRRDESEQIERVLVSEPIEGAVATVVDPAQLGGTRHLSAAQFVYDQRDAAAFVSSQDGRFTVLAWSAADGIVRAHRIETLLM